MFAIEFAFSKGWLNLWLECDSLLVVTAFKNVSLVPWKLRNRWMNCLAMTRRMRFHCSHIYREGNACADKLANFGFGAASLIWWNSTPSFIRDDFFRNKFGLPNYRFS